MDKIEVKKLAFKLLTKEPSYVGNSGTLYWYFKKYIIELLPNHSKNNYGIVIYARTENNNAIIVFADQLELDELDFLTVELAVLKYKESYREKLFNELISDGPSDPMDELLEDPKDE